MNGGKPVNVSNSTTPKSERLADIRPKTQWKNIDWKKVIQNINRLQTRITKAVLERKWQLVKRLQYLLTNSFYAKSLAVRTICQNKGKRTAGIDGEKWLTPKAKMNAALNLSNESYKAKPLKRVFIDKPGKKKKRPLGIPTMYDRAMQALYALALDPVAEATADIASFGFRKFRSAQDACAQAFTCLSRRNSAQWILEGDIKGCFDNINHDWLQDNIPMDKSILNQFLKAGFVYKHHLNPTKAGTPQGGIISPILANMTLDGIERTIANKYYSGKRWKSRNPKKVNFLRYADDFIVTAGSEETAKEIKELIEVFLMERGLELSMEKTLITHIDKGFDFLGWNFRKYKGKLLIKPSKKSIGNVTQKISDIVKKGKAWKQENLIDALNPVITGWTNYHQSVVSKETFNKLDHIVWNMLWRWAKRRHPRKSRSWVVRKYWHHEGTRNWVFSTKKNKLKLLSDTKIVRHRCLKLDRNPYIDKEYFDVRRCKLRARKMVNKPKTCGVQMNICSFA
ncbi:MAG TPA: group II intron reverse transcriptase/maturase [Methanosarcinaceae archaeon]|nr:group II intron reverse transcriptase/maturase [Methanosarcinaceae archaeon]